MERKKHPDDKVLPMDLEIIFNEEHIDLIWQYMDDNFTMNLKKWKEFFAIRCNMQRSISRCEMFARFGVEHFQGPMNKLLFRKDNHPTWISLIRYVVTINKKEVWEIHSKGSPTTKYRIINPK
jgi:hypothetical protein